MSTEGFVALDPARFVGQVREREVRLITLRAGPMQAAICNHGARLLQWGVPDARGQLDDVVLGHDSLAQLLMGMTSMGAFVGRFANRIANATYRDRGRTLHLPANDGPHCLHGGPGGSRHRVFDVLTLELDRVVLAWTFQTEDDGFPGRVDLQVSYHLQPDRLSIDYRAEVKESPTPLGFTTHPFFNLDGAGTAAIDDHVLQIDGSHYVPVDATRIPLGHLADVTGTPFDLRQPRRLSDAWADPAHPQLTLGVTPGFDHAWATPNPTRELRRQARLCAGHSGRIMEVWSDAPSIQLYSGLAMDGSLPRHAGKHGQVYGRNAGLCLEPQNFPDAPNQPFAAPCVLDPGQSLSGQMEYRFVSL
jgi:aldose 1-epimerase